MLLPEVEFAEVGLYYATSQHISESSVNTIFFNNLKHRAQHGLAFLFVLFLLAGCAPAGGAAAPSATFAPVDSYANLPAGAAPAGWRNLQSDPFDQNLYEWPVDQKIVNGEAYLDTHIGDGVYTWTANTLTGSFFFLSPATEDLTDIIVQVDAACPACKPQWDYGIIFRVGEGGWLYFSVNEEGTVKFLEFQDRFWTEVISPVTAAGFQPGQTNRLGLRAEGEQVTLLVNRQEVASTLVTRLAAGQLGLAISQTEPGEMQVIFDNWELLEKQGSQK